MNKYELALVVSAKLEDEERAAVVEKAKGYVTRYNGVISEVEEWGKKRLAYEASTTLFSLRQTHPVRRNWRDMSASWTMC